MDRLALTRLRVERFYGRDLPLAADLGPGLTVVHGGNGRGKTTLARAARGVVWPETVAADQPTYEARFLVGETPWDVRVEAGVPRYRANGGPSDAPPAPDASASPRYHLDLRDLLTDSGTDLAEAVRRQAVGGVDLAAVARGLGMRPTVPPRLDAAGAARQTADAVRALRDERDALRADEARLADLERDADGASAAAAEADLMGRLDARAAALDQRDAAARALAALPPALARVAPDTGERYAALATAVDDTARAAETAEQAAAAAAAEADAHGWAGLALPSPDVLAARLRRASDAAREVDAARGALASARARLEEARRPLGDAAPVAVSPEAVAEVAAHVREASRRAARLAAARDAERVLRTRHQDIRFHDPDALASGVRLLRQWLAHATETEAVAPRDLAAPVWIAAGIVAVASIALAMLVDPWAAVGLVGAVALAAVAWRLGQRAAPRDSPAERARLAYGGLAADAVTAPQPASWTVADVEALVVQMDVEAARQTERRLWKERAEETARSVTEAETAAAAAEAEGRALAARLGVGYPETPESFFVHVEALARAGEAARDVAGAEAALASAEAALADALDAFRAETASLPVPPAADAAGAEGVVATIRAESATRDRLVADAARARADADAARAATADAVAARDALLAPLGIGPDADAVAALVADLPRWTDARDRLREAEALAADADARARAHPGFRDDLASIARAELTRLRGEADARAARRDSLLREAERIRERVAQARRTRALSDAAARHEDALDRLCDTYDATADALVGHALAQAVADETRDSHLPRVFARARTLFATLTHDRYRLTLSGDEWAAVNAATGRQLTLDELSAGTRMQLLLAVRLAFVETQEAGLRLPLVLDEALATSDGARAEAVADAVLALVAGGRQVLAFTARADEVALWKRAASRQPDAPVAYVSLDGPAEGVPLPVTGESLDDYASRVGTPAWSPWEPVAALPVAALVASPADLHALLVRGVDRWGVLEAALRRDADLSLGRDRLDAMADRARAVAAWAGAWRQGRARRLDRDALAPLDTLDSETRRAAADLSEANGGDAERIIDALAADGALSSVRLAALAAACADGGFVTDAPRLDRAALDSRLTEATTDPEAVRRGLRRVRAFSAA